MEANGILPSVAMPERRAHHVLLGDVAPRRSARGPTVLEALGEGRVLGVAVDGHHLRRSSWPAWRARCRRPRASRPPGRACRRACTVGRRRRRARARRRVAARLDRERDVGVAQLGHRLLQLLALLHRLAVPAVLVLEERDALALERARHDGERLARRRRAPRAKASRSAATSWPSTTAASQPKAREARLVDARRRARTWWARSGPGGSRRRSRRGCRACRRTRTAPPPTPSPRPPRRRPAARRRGPARRRACAPRPCRPPRTSPWPERAGGHAHPRRRAAWDGPRAGCRSRRRREQVVVDARPPP